MFILKSLKLFEGLRRCQHMRIITHFPHSLIFPSPSGFIPPYSYLKEKVQFPPNHINNTNNPYNLHSQSLLPPSLNSSTCPQPLLGLPLDDLRFMNRNVPYKDVPTLN